ncbi:MAG: GntR family transcriptional regulator [Bacteroidetes bacterium GWD2_45_23]|nr:MAG: GntR family transcriptional regulator [Bacteroidetes bacterium GWC2_46_850]OFX81232.1 MAG: GntR family transcriptional regulator [Bacteroidetes bacterium GWC1_47_7]OFX85599.1 MAG: GntR family transcriptional regulator [Bacteroidetes bacterium GWD2_45_23]HAR37855.1 FadR family transcriptional regulator [Porphyromonadaceae bacterium]HBB00833.1 FadR family transcriptional regulator [Porphyromonadaceae bacterium]
MERLRIQNNSTTLVDQVEDKLLNYFKEKDLQKGDAIPNEMELTASLGVSRSVVREALSRLKMMGIVETRTRRGMVLSEPSIFGGMRRAVDPRILSEDTLFDILGFRIVLEIGICSEIFRKITPDDIASLEEIVNVGIMYENNEYAPFSEFAFHTKLYKITGNKTISEFQNIIHPVMTFVKDKFQEFLAPINIRLKEEKRIVTHQDLLQYLKDGDEDGYRRALEEHFEVYRIFISQRNQYHVALQNG